MTPPWQCNAHGCTKTATRTAVLSLVLHKTERPLASMRLCDSPACEQSARASLASKIEVRDGIQ